MAKPKGSKNKGSKLNSIPEAPKQKCLHCGTEKQDRHFYKLHNNSNIYIGNENYLPVCKDCIKALYEQYRIQYKNQFSVLGKTAEITEQTNKHDIEKLAIKRLCMAFDLYYSDSLFETALRNQENFHTDLLSAYMRMVNLKQNCKKTYDDTILEEDLSQELLRCSMVDEVKERFEVDGLYQDIYTLCLKLMESLKGRVNVHDCKINN